MKKLKTIIIMTLMIFFVACAEDLKKEPEAPISKPEIVATQNGVRIKSSDLEKSMAIKITGAEPEKYIAHFSWPYLEDKKILRIRVGDSMTEVLPIQTHLTMTLNHNQILKVVFDIFSEDRTLEESFSKTLLIPRDFVVTQNNHELKEDLKLEVER